MAEILFLDATETDFQEALTWYRERGLQTAIRFDAAVEAALRTIQKAPGIWTACDERHRLYSLKRFPHSIIY